MIAISVILSNTRAMPSTPPVHPDIRRQLKARLLDLSPRAFELFAGDLLVYVGLQNVAVTRFIGDGGIDAHGDLIAESGLVCIHAGVQVKRYRRNVRRPEIDELIGAYGGQYDRGIFITTAGYAEQARVRAATSPLLRVDTVDGNQLISLMTRHGLGIQTPSDSASQLDEEYFLGFEAQTIQGSSRVSETRATYQTSAEPPGVVVRPEDDLISLRALSYALRVDTTTLRDWIERGKLTPDRHTGNGSREGFFFRRDRVEQIRRALVGTSLPGAGAEWRQEFLDYARSHSLTKSYKLFNCPVGRFRSRAAAAVLLCCHHSYN
jgi:hypothetical protein